MKPYIQPTPDDQPQPAEKPVPAEQPRRRTFTQPTFGTGKTLKVLATLVLAAGLSAAQAQTHPVPDPPPPPGVPTKPLDPDDHRLPQDPPQKPGTPQPHANHGWHLFDDRVGKELGLQDDQLQRLRDLDGRYQKDHEALGNKPSEDPRYRSLSDRRNVEVKGILSLDQYERWMRMDPAHKDQMDHMERDTDGGMNKKDKTTPPTKSPGTMDPKSDPTMPSTPKPKTPPKN
jgi:hypothetical protein